MATLLVNMTIRAGREKRFEQIMRDLYGKTHADEPSVRRYEHFRGTDERKYYSLLAFDSHLEFIHHQSAPYHEAYSAELYEVFEEVRMEWLDPLEGAAPLRSTKQQELPPDASDGERRNYDAYQLAEAAWWASLRTAAARA
jgi:quinol monooxygenase YgiN